MTGMPIPGRRRSAAIAANEQAMGSKRCPPGPSRMSVAACSPSGGCLAQCWTITVGKRRFRDKMQLIVLSVGRIERPLWVGLVGSRLAIDVVGGVGDQLVIRGQRQYLGV